MSSGHWESATTGDLGPPPTTVSLGLPLGCGEERQLLRSKGQFEFGDSLLGGYTFLRFQAPDQH